MSRASTLLTSAYTGTLWLFASPSFIISRLPDTLNHIDSLSFFYHLVTWSTVITFLPHAGRSYVFSSIRFWTTCTITPCLGLTPRIELSFLSSSINFFSTSPRRDGSDPPKRQALLIFSFQLMVFFFAPEEAEGIWVAYETIALGQLQPPESRIYAYSFY